MFLDIWKSYRAMPMWVQLWVGLVLTPVNMASLFFISEPSGLMVAFLANIAMALNMPVILYDRGFSKLMALPHLVPWTFLLGIIIFQRPDASGLFDTYLWLLLVTNLVSLAFDYPDAVKWCLGDRKPAGR